MGQKHQDGENLQYSSYFFWKGKAGAGCEMKVSNCGRELPFPNGWGILVCAFVTLIVDFWLQGSKLCKNHFLLIWHKQVAVMFGLIKVKVKQIII